MVDTRDILKARTASELFGTNEKRAKITYRRLARTVHPDLFQSAKDKLDAEHAFKKLNDFWDSYNNTSSPRANGNPVKQNTVKTKKQEYAVHDEIFGDPFFNRMEADYDDGHEKVQILISSKPQNNDLADNHVRKVQKLQDEVPDVFKPYFPVVIESFKHLSETKVQHQGVVQKYYKGLVPFSKILERYPEGISGKDVGWIFRRMLFTVGNAHDLGIVHGSVSLDSLYIQPEAHGLVLDDWQYSVGIGDKLVAVPQKWKGDYHEKYLKREPVTTSLDINLCAKVADRLLAKNQPRRLRNFFKVCMNERTLDAGTLLREFEVVLKELYGNPTFHPFTLK